MFIQTAGSHWSHQPFQSGHPGDDIEAESTAQICLNLLSAVTGGENAVKRCYWAARHQRREWVCVCVCNSCSWLNIQNRFSHRANRGFVTLLNSKQMNLPPGFSTRSASCRAWEEEEEAFLRQGGIAHTSDLPEKCLFYRFFSCHTMSRFSFRYFRNFNTD